MWDWTGKPMSEADEKVVAVEVGNEQANKDAKLE